ncbi:MBL fold metallo-hydrolase [Actinoplanes flavus]|uniref:MBL fold metallo-hydrolase n=1 Tax=Actinoplanes flavus TaxID=2820290 RepID=A0ABS3UG12_9ACTN|nr:MBL fold metallo-hydrolase [Actinoplanes flavus]MBO3737713.1 MBL fold metallo-hydrolase [Actinoplanes flavus]
MTHPSPPPLTIPVGEPQAIRVGRRRVVALVEAVGPALPARATYPGLDADSLTALLAATGSPATSTPYLHMASQGFAILGAGRIIIVDTGLGGPKPGRPRPRPGLDSRWLHTAAQAGIDPADVDTVINTHLHHDHVGWNTTMTGTRLRPTFPAAQYLNTAPEYVHATARPQRHVHDSVLPLDAAGQLHRCPPGYRLDDEVRLVPAPGHTPGHTLVEITSHDERLVLAGDLIHHPLQLRRPDLGTSLCTDADQAGQTRRAILDRYADTNTLMLASHLPTGGHLHRDGTGYRIQPVPARTRKGPVVSGEARRSTNDD